MQVFEVGTATMMAATGAVKPVHVLMKEAGESVRSQGLSADHHRLLFDSSKGEMLSFPFNSSSTVMWYNKDGFKKAGLDPDKPPKTWPEVFDAAKKLKAAGHRQLRLRQCLGDVGQPRAARRLAQHAPRHQGQRHGRLWTRS